MPPQDRFESLESAAPLPEELKSALNRLSRFDALEIGAAPKAPASQAPQQPPPPRPGAPAPGVEKVPCAHCGQLNERDRETCWACYSYVSAKTPPKPADKGPADVTLVLDGVTYTSSQRDLPDDVRELMARIRKDGYSERLLADWRSWRATRHAAPLPTSDYLPMSEQSSVGSDDALGIKVFRGQRVSVLRLDGKVYTSDDPALSQELKMLFDYIEVHGVTPTLMDHLRQMGGVKVRPATTAYPSDGDVAFWNSVNAGAGEGGDLRSRLAEADAQRDLAQATLRYNESRRRMTAAAIGVAVLLLYLIVTLVSR